MLTISYDKLLEVYFQKPEFGYYFLRLSSDRLMQNFARLEDDHRAGQGRAGRRQTRQMHRAQQSIKRRSRANEKAPPRASCRPFVPCGRATGPLPAAGRRDRVEAERVGRRRERSMRRRPPTASGSSACSRMFLNIVISLLTRSHAAAAPLGLTSNPALNSFSLVAGSSKDLERLRLDPFDGFRRCFRWSEQGQVHRQHEVVVAGFGHGRHIGQAGPAALAGDRKTAQRASLDMRRRGRQRARAHLHRAAQKRLQCVSTALEHDILKFWQVLAQLQHLGRDKRHGSDRRAGRR